MESQSFRFSYNEGEAFAKHLKTQATLNKGLDMTPDKYRCKIFLNTCNNEK
jgi:hypothetical protein